MKKIAILGSTGSIGTQTLEVVRANQDIQVLGISAGRNVKMLEKQVREFHPSLVAVWDETAAADLSGFPIHRRRSCPEWKDLLSLPVCRKRTFW